MIVLSLALLGFGVADLVRWSPEPVSVKRALVAAVGATAATSVLAALSGLQPRDVALTGVIMLVVLAPWLLFEQPPLERRRSGYLLAWILVVLLVAFATSGLTDPLSGSFGRWYSNLPFRFARTVSADQFVLGLSATLFLLATANRIVRLVLEAAGTPAAEVEAKLSGGRVLGPRSACSSRPWCSRAISPVPLSSSLPRDYCACQRYAATQSSAEAGTTR